MKVRDYEVEHMDWVGSEGRCREVIAARSRSAARFAFASGLAEVTWMPVGKILVRCSARALGPVSDRRGTSASEAVRRCAEHRGVPIRRGDTVRTVLGTGVVVGAGSGANFEILVPGHPALFFHPSEIMVGGE